MSPMVSCETFSWDNTFNKNILHLSNNNIHHANNSIRLIHNLQRQVWGPDTILHHTLSVPCAAAEGSHVSSLLTPAARSLEVSEDVDAESSKSWRQNFQWFNHLKITTLNLSSFHGNKGSSWSYKMSLVWSYSIRNVGFLFSEQRWWDLTLL